MDYSYANDQESVPFVKTIEPLGVLSVEFTRKFKVRREWREAFPKGRFILAEYNHGQFYRAYLLTSTIHQSGKQIITSLLFFPTYEIMTGYIAQCNLPTELYHTYSTSQLSTNRYAITDFKIRYNRAENTAYFTLPSQNRILKDTSLRIGDIVNITLCDQITKTKQNIALHKVLAKEDNYCAIRLSPTATKYFISYYQIDEFPLLATRHITMIIEKAALQTLISSLRFRRVNLAKPALLEEIFRTNPFLELLSNKYRFGKIIEADLHFGPDGRQRPDLELESQSKDGTSIQVIGECKAVGQQYAQRALQNALVQLLFYKTKNDYKTAQRGLLIVTGKPRLPSWNKIKQIIQNYGQRDPKVKLYRYSSLVESHLKKHRFLRKWCQHNLELITGNEIRSIIQKMPDSDQIIQLNSLLHFIEK